MTHQWSRRPLVQSSQQTALRLCVNRILGPWHSSSRSRRSDPNVSLLIDIESTTEAQRASDRGYVIPLDNKLSNLLRFPGADNRQAFDRSCTKEALDVERLPEFMGENRRKREPAVEQFARCQANSQRCRSGRGLRCLQHKG